MDGVIITDEHQRITLFNSAAEMIYRCSASQVIGQSLDILIPAHFRMSHRTFVDVFGRNQVTKRQMGRIHAVEITGLRADGEEFPAEVSISQFESEGKKFYTAIIRDITER